MEQQAFKLNTSVGAANVQKFADAQRNTWVEKFLENARKALGLPAQSKSNVDVVAQELEQLGYFGFAHYLNIHANRTADHPLGQNRIHRRANAA